MSLSYSGALDTPLSVDIYILGAIHTLLRPYVRIKLIYLVQSLIPTLFRCYYFHAVNQTFYKRFVSSRFLMNFIQLTKGLKLVQRNEINKITFSQYK